MNNMLKKIIWIGGVLVVFLLILATNLIDRRNIKGVRTSVSTMYEDRLIVKNIIFDISQLTEEKKIAFLLSDSSFYSTKAKHVNDSIYSLIDRFSNTVLTQNEVQYLERLHTNFKEVEAMENQLVHTKIILKNEEWRKKMDTQLARIKTNLNFLSDIQIDEGKRELSRVNRAFNTIDLFTNIEIAFLVVLGIIAQIIVIYPLKKEK